MLDADRPILKSEQDRLGRSQFTKYLARCMLDQNNHESLAIGLFGGWGSGKTSIINLTIEELGIAASSLVDEEKPIILNFSPWSYSGQHQLLYAFFKRLSSAIRQSTFLENANQITQLLDLYVSFFTHQTNAKPLPSKKQIAGWESGRDLTHIKAELNHVLSKQKHKFIIFIDNISRLESNEINQIFQITKSIGDYANTIYVLAMDKDHVAHAMSRIHQDDGKQYLDKLVQLSFDLPVISRQDVEKILLDRLSDVMKFVPKNSWNTEYWSDLYHASLKHIFHHCRDITHYVNSLIFSYPRVKEIVNPVDFFAITAIKVFSPQVYSGIRNNKDLFTDLISAVYEADQDKLIEDKARCDEILNREGRISHSHLLQLVIHLFPRLRSIYAAAIPFYHSESLARKNHRICNPDIFDVYFRLSISSEMISEPEMNAILSLTHDETGFTLELLRLNQDNKIISFLDLLDSVGILKIPVQHIGNVVSALVDSADLFPEGKNSLLQFNTPMRIHRILRQLLNRLDSPVKRFDIFRDAIKKSTKSVYILVHELNLQHKEHIENEDTFIPVSERQFTPEQLSALQTLTVTKIIYWAHIGRLIEHPKLIPILYAWKAWGNEIEWKQFIGRVTQDDKGLLAFLCAALKTPIDQAITKLQKNPAWESSIETIEDFISVQILEPHAKMLFEDLSFENLREREQLALLIFLDLIKAKTTKTIPNTAY